MKKCSYCGKVYADTATVCEVDQNPLWQVDPPQLPGTLPPPPPWNAREMIDNEHIRLLAIFQYIFSGLAFAGLLFLFLHFLIMGTVFGAAMSSSSQRNSSGPPPELFAFLAFFYFIGGAMLVAAGVGNILSANFMRKRKHRAFSFVVACLNCLQIPFGTALGVFTIIVLSRDSVRAQYPAG